jgi:L-serine kinase (ADP)
MNLQFNVEFLNVSDLVHIEGFSKRRVVWLAKKILNDNVWTLPIAVDERHNLVLDGQHRLEVAKSIGLKYIPAVRYQYSEVETWSLRPDTHPLTVQDVVIRALANDPYPYKTVKHKFVPPLPTCSFPLKELR